jgi:hypothetical protein
VRESVRKPLKIASREVPGRKGTLSEVLRYAVDGRKDWPISTCKGEAFCGADSESALVVKKRVDCALGCSQATGCCLNTKQFHRFYTDKLTCERLWSRDHMISPIHELRRLVRAIR